MTRDEFLDFYDEHWNDYNAVYEKLLKLFEEHEREIAVLKQDRVAVPCDEKERSIEHLKSLLQKCQDRLDEETHRL